MYPGRQGRTGAEHGFTFVAMLFALAIFGIGLAALGQTWRRVADRDKEDELLQVGAAYVQAIGQYHRRSPGTPKTYPARLTDLLEDNRFVGTERHLRRLYRDPVANSVEWGLVRAPDGGITGVYSLSQKATLRQRPVALAGTVVAGQRYAEWKFIYQPGLEQGAAASAAGGNHVP